MKSLNRLTPVADFNWLQVSWGGPDEPVATECSYCNVPFTEDEVPLMLGTEAGWVAQFCEACCQRYWRMGSV